MIDEYALQQAIQENKGKGDEAPRSWDAASWLEMFRPVWESRDRRLQHRVRAAYYQDHIRFVQERCYISQSGKKVTIPWSSEEMAQHTQMYRNEMHPQCEFEPKQTKVEFWVEDCLVAAKKMQENTDGKTAVLNLANRSTPGGGVYTGSGAQEESCFLRSNYYASLYPFSEFASKYDLPRADDQYPMDANFGGVWSEGITIFRGRELEGYPLLDEPWKTNFIAVAGIKWPDVVVNEEG